MIHMLYIIYIIFDTSDFQDNKVLLLFFVETLHRNSWSRPRRPILYGASPFSAS